MEQEQTAEESGAPASTLDFSAIAEASEEELDEALASIRSELDEATAEDENDEEPESETSGQELNSTEEGDTQEASSETESDASQTGTQEGNPERVAKLEKQLRDKQQFINRQAAEIGELRKAKSQQLKELENNLDEAFAESSLKGLEVSDKIKALKEDLENLDEEERGLLKRYNNEQIFNRHFKGETVVHVNDLAGVLKEDGLPEDAIQDFVKDPYGSTDALTLIQMTKRAIVTKAALAMHNEIQKLRAQVKELEGKPDKVLNGVKQALSKTPSVTSRSGNAKTRTKGGIGGITSESIATMSDAELDDLAAEVGVKF